MKSNLKSITTVLHVLSISREPKKLPRLISSAAKYKTETGTATALTETVEEEDEDGDTKEEDAPTVNGDLEDGTLADDEAEVTDIRKEDEGETKGESSASVPGQGEEDVKKSFEESSGDTPTPDVTEQNKVNEQMESTAPAENNGTVINEINYQSSNNDQVIEKDHKKLEGKLTKSNILIVFKIQLKCRLLQQQFPTVK